MSSKYSCIITLEDTIIPVELPHFFSGSVLTIPFEADGIDVDEFLRFFKNGTLIFPDNADPKIQGSLPAEDTTDEDIQEPYGAPEIVLKVLQDLDLICKEFIVMHTADWADIPTDDYEAAFSNGNLVQQTYHSSDDSKPHSTGDRAVTYLGITYEDIAFFRDYDDAANKYVESVFKPGLWRD